MKETQRERERERESDRERERESQREIRVDDEGHLLWADIKFLTSSIFLSSCKAKQMPLTTSPIVVSVRQTKGKYKKRRKDEKF